MESRTPRTCSKLAKDERRRVRRRALLRPAGPHAALLDARSTSSPRTCSRRARVRRLVDPRVPGDPGVRHAPDPRPEHRGHRPVPRAHDAQHQLLRAGPGHGRVVLAATRATSRRRPRTTSRAPASPTPRTSVPRPSSTSSTRCASTRTSTRATTSSTRIEGVVELGPRARARRLTEPRVQAAVQGGLLPGPADGPVPGPALRDGADARAASASRSRCSTTRSAPPARPRSTCASTRCCAWPTSSCSTSTSSRTSRAARGQDGHVHAEAALPGQRLGHARAPVAVEGRRAAVLRREGLRRPLRPRALVHRRPARARAVDPRVHEPDHELVQAARARATRRR